jgi:hypothetical protein
VSLPPSFSQLTIADILDLIKYFFTALFACALVFVLPYAIIVGFFSAVDFTTEGTSYSWVSRAIVILMALYIVFKVFIEDPARTFQYFADMFSQLSAVARRLSRFKAALLVGFLIVYWWLFARFPIFAFFFSVLVLAPSAFTYDHYQEILRKKTVTSEHAIEEMS